MLQPTLCRLGFTKAGLLLLLSGFASFFLPAQDRGIGCSAPEQHFRFFQRQPLLELPRDLPHEDAIFCLRLILPAAYQERTGKQQKQTDLILELPVRSLRPQFEHANAKASLRYWNRNFLLRADAQAPLALKVNPESTITVSGVLLLVDANGQTPLRLRLNLKIENEFHRYTPDPDFMLPPWRSDKTKPNGRKVVGRFALEPVDNENSAQTAGEIDANSCYALLPEYTFGVEGAMQLDSQVSEALQCEVYLSPKRVWDGEAAWAIKVFPQALDLGNYSGIRLKVSSTKAYAGKDWPGIGVTVGVALRMKDGPWYYARTVAPLLGGTQSFVTGFDLFVRGGPAFGGQSNRNYFLDARAIDAVAVGINYPFGLGKTDRISFSVHELEAVRYAMAPLGNRSKAPLKTRIYPLTFVQFNDTQEIPKGLFGFHRAGGAKKPAYWDQPPIEGDAHKFMQLTRPGFLRPLQHTSMGGRAISIHEAQKLLQTAEAEAQNPEAIPGKEFLLAQAADAADHTMLCVTNANLWARPDWMNLDDLEPYAQGIRYFFRIWGARAWSPPQRFNALRMLEFWNEPFMWARHINRDSGEKKRWDDPTQFSYLPGRLCGEVYGTLFNAAAQGAKEVNPHVKLGGMSSTCFGDDFFAYVTLYLQPFLDRSHELLDFITEHHYQGDPWRIAADYEVLTAFTEKRYSKRWPIYNTETNDLFDVATARSKEVELTAAYKGMNRIYYNIRDIMELLRVCPDKAKGRAVHASWNEGWLETEGEFQLYSFVSALRGTLLKTEEADGDIVTVAARNADGSITALILNDSTFERSLEIQLQTDREMNVPASSERLYLDEAGGAIRQQGTTFKSYFVAPEGRHYFIFDTPMLPRELRRITIPAQTFAGEPRKIEKRKQYHTDLVLIDCLPGKAYAGNLKLDAALAQAERYQWQVVTRDVQNLEAHLEIGEENSVRIELPASFSAPSSHAVQFPLTETEPLKALVKAALEKGLTEIPVKLTVADGYDGYTFCMGALVAIATTAVE